MANQSTKHEGEASATTLRRLMKEYQTEQKIQHQQSASSGSGSGNKNATSSAVAASRDENILYLAPKDTEGTQLLEWQASIRGPPGGSYEGRLCSPILIQN